MSESTYKPRNYRIVRHVTKNRILDVQDALEIDKLRIELVEFVEGEGAKLAVEHFAEPDALALICHDILSGRPWEKYIEYKGSVQGETVTSRVLVAERVEARNPVKITVSRGPGKVMGQGAIQPFGRPEASLAMLLSDFDARRIAFTILRHLAAYEAATYHARVAAGTRRPMDPGLAASDGPAHRAAVEVTVAEATPALSQAASPRAESAPVEAPAQPATTPLSRAPQPAPRPAPHRAPSVETYWMAAERLGISRAEAEGILERAKGDWGQAWQVLRTWQDAARRN